MVALKLEAIMPDLSTFMEIVVIAITAAGAIYAMRARLDKLLKDFEKVETRIEAAFLRIDENKNESISVQERLHALEHRVDTLSEKSITDKDIERKYLQIQIFEMHEKHINERFAIVERKLDEINTSIKDIVEYLKK